MSKIFIGAVVIMGVFFFGFGGVNAQMMMGYQGGGVANGGVSQEIYDHTLREEAEGKELWEKLQAKEVSCDSLTEEQFAVLGEYFMGIMTGAAHPAMNAMMIQMHGEEGEEAIHISMGKRLSGCDTSAALPSDGFGWMPMMNTVGTGWYPRGMSGGWSQNSMMGFGRGGYVGIIGFVFMIVWWALIVIGVISVLRWFVGGGRRGKVSALDILKERYARGEITKEEFDTKKKEVTS